MRVCPGERRIFCPDCIRVFEINPEGDNQKALTVSFAGFVYINGALCSFYYLNCLWQLIQFREFEYSSAPWAFFSSVGVAAVEQAVVAAFWALCNNLHQ
jgi:hypothetical protein